jgi:uroporphyrinogen decarboxylase
VHISQFMRGFQDWYMDVAANPGIFEALLDACLEVNLAVTQEVLGAVGREVDVVMTADDLGTQTALQCSPRHYRKHIKPRHARFFDAIHSATDAKLLFHTCGAVRPIIGDLIDIGVDVLNPIQPRAANMDPGEIKREFGHRVVFWGCIDIQQVLPFGSVDDVYAEVQQRFEQLGQGGGWVLCPAHNIQPEVPPQNIVALYQAGKAIGTYS